MILPIVGYGSPILRQVCEPITSAYPELDKLIADMWQTMYNSNGVGLAAPQINKSIRLFVVDTVQMVEGAEEDEKEDYKNEKPIKQAFINAKIIALDGQEWSYNEGCLSIPKVRGDVMRAEQVTLEYMNESFALQTQTFNGITARVILHEYDHIDGKLFIDKINKGIVSASYKMIFPK
jgi:peptide deformylase